MANLNVSVIFDAERSEIPGMSNRKAVLLRDIHQARAFFGMATYVGELFLDYELKDGHNTFEVLDALDGVELGTVIFHSTDNPEQLPLLQWHLQTLGYTKDVLTFSEFLKLPSN